MSSILTQHDGKFVKFGGQWIGVKKPFTLTLQNDGNGTLTATKLTGYAGDTVTLTPTYNTYYRFSGYENTGGEIIDNTFTFGEDDATAKAYFSGNKFFVSGIITGDQKTTVNANGAGITSAYMKPKYNKYTYISGDVPSYWLGNNNYWYAYNALSGELWLSCSARFRGGASTYSEVSAILSALDFNNNLLQTCSASKTNFATFVLLTADNNISPFNNQLITVSGILAVSAKKSTSTGTISDSAMSEDPSFYNWSASGYAP